MFLYNPYDLKYAVEIVDSQKFMPFKSLALSLSDSVINKNGLKLIEKLAFKACQQIILRNVKFTNKQFLKILNICSHIK